MVRWYKIPITANREDWVDLITDGENWFLTEHEMPSKFIVASWDTRGVTIPPDLLSAIDKARKNRLWPEFALLEEDDPLFEFMDKDCLKAFVAPPALHE